MNICEGEFARIVAHNFFISENALHAKISDVIAVGVGHHINSIDLQAIATDAAHIIQESDADDLINHKSQIVQLLCS